jgi:hypothetical protein
MLMSSLIWGDNVMTRDKAEVINCKLDGIPATGE